MKITKENFKKIVREVMTEESEYQTFFKKALEKTGKSIPDMSDEEKKEFFNKIDSAWQGKGEKKNEGNAFGAAVSDAKEKGEDEFKVGGEKFKVNEGKLSDTWRKNNKKGYVLKVGNIELKSAGPSKTHDIYKNGYMWGKFHMDYESGGTDWWVEPGKGSDFYVKTIDDIVKKVKADSRFNESVNEAGGNVRNPKTGKDVKISTALSYGKSHPAYQAAKQASGAAKKPIGPPPGVKAKPPVNAKPAMGTKVTSAPPKNAQPPIGTKVTGPPPGVKSKPPVIVPPSATKAPLGPPPGVKSKPPVIVPPSAKPAGTPPGVRPKGAVPPPPPPPPTAKRAVPPPPPPPPPVPPKKSKFEDKESVKEKKKIKK